MCTIMMLAIIQGLYILRKDEDEQLEEEKRQKTPKRPKKKDDPSDRGGNGPGREPEEADDLERRIEEQTEKSLNW